MPTWLLKTEPSEYSYDDLVREKRSAWTGVTNAAAQMHMRSMAKGDEVLIYHTGDERAIAGLASVVRGAYEDPDHAGVRTAKGEIKFSLVDLTPKKKARSPVALAALKGDARFAEFALLKQARLSVMPVPAALDKVLRTMAGL